MSPKIRKEIERRKREIARRLDKDDNRGCDQPIMTASNIHYEIAGRTRATAAGGIGAMHLLVRKLGLDEAIDRHLDVLKIHLPYFDSDHVLNIAYNLLAGGECLEHLELLRTNVAYLNALGARRIPDPTTAGDFCRRFDASRIYMLQQLFNATRLKVWRKQPDSRGDRERQKARLAVGSVAIHTHLLGDLLVVCLQGVLTAAEQHLVSRFPPKRGGTC